jgi:hypothetical protein
MGIEALAKRTGLTLDTQNEYPMTNNFSSTDDTQTGTDDYYDTDPASQLLLEEYDDYMRHQQKAKIRRI